MDFEGAFFNSSDYELRNKKLGQGSYGTVYVARNVKDHHNYAAKVLKCDFKFDGHDQTLLLRETLILHRLNYPSIVKFKGVNFSSLTDPLRLEPTIITEYLPHGSLREMLRKERKGLADANWNSTKKYISLLGIAAGMRYLHRKGIIHRDLKPENVLLDKDFYPRICDFGLSRCYPNPLTKYTNITMSGNVGTPLYMAPELFEVSGKCTSGIDVYAFSILAYEIVTGEKPFSELGKVISPFVFSNKIISGCRPKFTQNVPSKMKDLIEKCWSKKVEERPTFEEIFDLLSDDFSYFDEEIDKDEVIEYLDRLSEFGNDPDDAEKSLKEENEQLKEELDQLKTKCNKYESELKSLLSTNDEYSLGLFSIVGEKKNQNIHVALKHLKRASENGNCHASYLLGILYSSGELVEKDVKKAINYYKLSFDQGNPKGYTTIGTYYNIGNLVEQDHEKAFEFFSKAADQGEPAAMNNLGNLLFQGIGVEKNIPKAIELYKKAEKVEYPNAFINLGDLYIKGIGVEPNCSKAIEYYRKAAYLGCYIGFERLGNLYANGKVVDQDFETAFQYYQLAAENGSSNAYLILGNFYKEGKGVSQDYSKALENYQKSADLGGTEALNRIGAIYEGNYHNFSKAADFFKQGSDLGDSYAMTNLGVLYMEGKGVKQDYSKSFSYFEQAAALGNPKALIKLGNIYENRKDFSKAREYYERAGVDFGDPVALNCLGDLYFEGKIKPQDYEKALQYYQQSADKGCCKAFISLGNIYKKGLGVEPDYAKAYEYYQEAYKLGDPQAAKILKKLQKKKK